MDEKDLKSIFDDANNTGQQDLGGEGNKGDKVIDSDGVPTKSADELEKDMLADGDGTKVVPADGTEGAGDGAGSQGTKEPEGDADGDYDTEVLDALFGVISEKAGASIEGVSIKTPEDLVNAIENIIESKSKPKYASSLSEQFDKFVSEGGDPYEFMLGFTPDMQIPRVNSQEDKELLVRTLLKDAGYSDLQIDKKIDSYIESNTLDKEAEDAVDIIKRRNSKLANEQAENYKKAQEQAEREEREFIKSIETHIDGMTDFRGIPITKAQKLELKEYMLKVDKKDGLTQFQRDNASSVSNLIESAFFNKNKNTLLKAAEGRGATDAVSKLNSLLKNNNNKVSGTQRRNDNNQKNDLGDWLKQAAFLTGARAA